MNKRILKMNKQELESYLESLYPEEIEELKTYLAQQMSFLATNRKENIEKIKTFINQEWSNLDTLTDGLTNEELQLIETHPDQTIKNLILIARFTKLN